MSDEPDDHGDDPGPPAELTPEYKVGYCRPPEHGKIKPGEVRNKRGPLKGTRSLKNDIRDVLNLPVPLTGPGKQRKVTTRKAALLKLREKALKGDSRSLDRMVEFAREQDLEEGLIASTGKLMAEDEAIYARAVERAILAVQANAPLPEAEPRPTEESE